MVVVKGVDSGIAVRVEGVGERTVSVLHIKLTYTRNCLTRFPSSPRFRSSLLMTQPPLLLLLRLLLRLLLFSS